MKKKIATAMAVLAMIFMTGCSNKALEAAKVAVEEYNAQVTIYNEMITPYNTAVEEISSKNEELQNAINSAQEVINQGDTPFQEETLSSLKNVMETASTAKVAEPETLEMYKEVSIDENAKKSELEAMTDQVISDTEMMVSFSLPDLPEVPDYSEELDQLSTALNTYQDSIQSLKQITAPSDEFVMERLQTIDTITEMDAVTEDHDPNGQLNKQGGYIGCIYFRDSEVDWSKLYIESGKENVIDVGCDGGGALEIFNTADEAEVRSSYLGTFDGTGYASGSHYVYGTILVRTSNELTGTKQRELTDAIVQALTYVEH